MPLITKTAESSSELNETLSFRYQVLADKHSLLSSLFIQAQKISDHFDSYPETINGVAFSDSECLGNIRAIQYHPSDCYGLTNHDFSLNFKEIDDRCFLIDMILISPRKISSKLILQEILKSITAKAYNHHAKIIFVDAPLDLKSLFQEFGFYSLVDEKSHQEKTLPLALNVYSFIQNAEKKINDKEILNFSNISYRTIFFPGEFIFIEGEKGNAAYLIEEGQVQIYTIKNDSPVLIGELNAGSLVGEIAMATGDRRTATVMAKSIVSCLAFDRTNFIKAMYDSPSKSIDVFKIFSKRLMGLNQRLATQKDSPDERR